MPPVPSTQLPEAKISNSNSVRARDARSSFAELLSRSHSLPRFVFRRLPDVPDYSSDVEESEWIDSQRMFIFFTWQQPP
jgi:hypothetical protein